MIKKKTVRILTAFISAVMAFSLLVRVPVSAATNITIDEDVYNLVTEDGPAEIGDEVYSKFVSNVKNVDDYSLMSDEDEAFDSFKTWILTNIPILF